MRKGRRALPIRSKACATLVRRRALILWCSALPNQNPAPKSQPPNPVQEIFTRYVEETARESVSGVKKIAPDAEKVPEARAN
jgi:hypothetical protein